MDIVRVEYCVEDALRRGLRDEAVFVSVMARINRPGVEADWGSPPITDPFWMEQMTREANGRKSSKKQIEAASNRYIINCWEEHLLAKLEAEAIDPQVFVEEAEGDYVPCGTLTALDEGQGWDVTLARRVRRTPPDRLLRDLEPILISLARRARRAFTLEEAHEDDLKQEARVKIFDGLGSYEGRCAFSTWAHRVAWRTMVDVGRRVVARRKNETVGIDDFEEEARDEFLQVDDRLVLRPRLCDAVGAVPNSELVILQALDYQDSEISDQNIRMKRLRAGKKLVQRLQGDPEIIASLGANAAV